MASHLPKTSTAARSCCCGEQSRSQCDQNTCFGLECLERPRFFAGQLLTEGELNDAQAYHRAKQRLHNLHLHGWGVVCGLEVVCHECAGWVVVQPGYAIDPCGEDLIVCREHELDVAKLIRDCKLARRSRLDCERPQHKGDCTSEQWCITLRYVEQEARPVTGLNRQTCTVCGCGPGCACSCPCHDSAQQRSRAGAVSPCEPTRILESYVLEVCEAPPELCHGLTSPGERAWWGKLEDCVAGLRKTFKKAPLLAIGTMVDVQLSSFDISTGLGMEQQGWTVQNLSRSFTQLHDFLSALVRNNPGNLHCSLLTRLEALEAPVVATETTTEQYLQAVRRPGLLLLEYLLHYVVDCLCWALQPPCAPCCPDEDLLYLACLEVSEGQDREIHIDHICTSSCRRHAGAFPPTIAGFHLGPVWPLVNKLLGLLCCDDLVERLLLLLRGSKKGQDLLRFVGENRFARTTAAVEMARAFDLNEWLGASPDRVSLVAMNDQPVEQAMAMARQAGLQMTVQEVTSVPVLAQLQTLRAVKPQEQLIAYSLNGRIVGFARTGSAEAALVDQAAELAAIRKELTMLRSRVGG